MSPKEKQLSKNEKKYIRKKMRTSDNICPSNNPEFSEHNWEKEPREPDGSTRESIRTLQASNNPSEQFEGKAAQKNLDDGDLIPTQRDRSSKVSRNTSADERRKGENGDAHKVFRHCIREGCQVKCEVDHIIEKEGRSLGQAEVKDIEEQFDSFEQMRKNASIQHQTGCPFIYKINGEYSNVEQVKKQIEYAAKVSNFHITIKII